MATDSQKELAMNLDERIASLKVIVTGQMELLRLSLYISTQGPVEYKGELATCSLSESKIKASAMIAMAAGQSVNTILKISEWRGIPVRDLYPIARCALESFINAAYLIAEDDSVSERAIRHVAFASYRQRNREVGNGKFSIEISTQPKASAEDELRFAEFKGRGNSNWTTLDASSRMNKVGLLMGDKPGSRLLAGYALLYSLSSEIIHGSPFGVNYFYQAHLPVGGNVDDFREATARQVEDVLVAVIHGVAGYLSAFFTLQNMGELKRAEQSLFNTYLVLEGIEPQVE